MNIVTKWLELYSEKGQQLKLALDDLAKATDIQIKHSRLREWERGERGVPPAAYNHMLRIVLADSLNSALYEQLKMPEKEQHNVEQRKISDY